MPESLKKIVLIILASILFGACDGAPATSTIQTVPAIGATSSPKTEVTASVPLSITETPAPPSEAVQPTQAVELRIDITPPIAQIKKVTHFEVTGFTPGDTVGVIFTIPNGAGGAFPDIHDAGTVTADASGKASYDLKFDDTTGFGGTSGNDTPGWWIATIGSKKTQQSIQRGFEVTYATDEQLQNVQATVQAIIATELITVTPSVVTKSYQEVDVVATVFKPYEAVDIYLITPEGLFGASTLSGAVDPFGKLNISYLLSLAFRPVTPGTWRVRMVSKETGKVGEGTFAVTKEAFLSLTPTPNDNASSPLPTATDMPLQQPTATTSPVRSPTPETPIPSPDTSHSNPDMFGGNATPTP